MLNFAINHMSFPNASFEAVLGIAADCGCVGIEVRNDLSSDIFTGLSPAQAKALSVSSSMRILALAQLNDFNEISDTVVAQAQLLIDTAVACGAESIVLIPENNGTEYDATTRKQKLTTSLTELKPLFKQSGIQGMIEPLGFASSSLRYKAEVVDVIEAIDASDCFKLVHDTFHHFVAGEENIFAEHTGIVHVSGVANATVAAIDMTDAHRGFVDSDDQLNNMGQLKQLIDAGFKGPVSMEAFSPDVHASTDSASKLSESFNFISSALTQQFEPALHSASSGCASSGA